MEICVVLLFLIINQYQFKIALCHCSTTSHHSPGTTALRV